MRLIWRHGLPFLFLMALGCLPILSTHGADAPAKPPAKAKPSAEKVAPTDPESLYLGCEIYKHHCACCHGTCGKGDGGAAYCLPTRPSNLSDSDYWDESDEDLYDVITKGQGAMPRYKKMLTEKQRLQVVAYMRTLAPKPVENAETKTGSKTDAKPSGK